MKAETVSRSTAAKRNIVIAVLYQVTAAVCGLILPRYMLTAFGSEANGVIQSISQLLNYATLFGFGIGGMITASFYKPLAFGDEKAVSDIYNNAKNFFGRLSYVFAAFVVVICLISKLVIRTDFDFAYVAALALILGTGQYLSSYVALAPSLLLKADQKLYVFQSVQIITHILNTIVCVLIIKLGSGIHLVKLASAAVYLLHPVVFYLYIRKHYNISKTIFDKNRRLPRKSDGMAHHIAYFIHNNTDIVILGIFCGAKEVSVYSIYYSVIILAENFLEAVSAGISGAVGNIIAKRQEETLHSVFNTYSSVNIAVSTFFCTAAAVLVIPFVSVYTDGVTDINYIRPVFACLMLLSLWVYCLRIPFLNVISAAGHYRQTKPGAFMEMFINLGLSLMLVGRFGLCGAAFGTLAAITARLVYSAVYLSRHLIENEVMTLLKKAAVNFAAGAVFASAAITLFDFAPSDITEWFMIAVPVGAASLAFIAGVNCILNKKLVAEVLKKNRK